MSHQADPVRLVRADIMHDIPILHKLGNHGECPSFRVDINSEEFQNIRMRNVHQKHRLLAEVLYPEFHVS